MVLCIDTTSPFAGITLVGDQTFYQKLELQNVSEKIVETIDVLIQKAGVQLSDLKAIFVIKGPGSFTGLRVGIAVANQFAHQLKIPIVGLRTDEWWKYRTDTEDLVYLQSMNRAELYLVGFGAVENAIQLQMQFNCICNQNANASYIIPLKDLKFQSPVCWLGKLSDAHRQQLPSTFTEIDDLRSAEETWAGLVKNTSIQPQKTYDLIKPFYGKEPTITKSKKKLSI